MSGHTKQNQAHKMPVNLRFRAARSGLISVGDGLALLMLPILFVQYWPLIVLQARRWMDDLESMATIYPTLAGRSFWWLPLLDPGQHEEHGNE